jgi:stage III sporulation protein AE
VKKKKRKPAQSARAIVLILLSLWLLTGRAAALDLQRLQQESIDTASLEEAAPDTLDGIDALDTQQWSLGLSRLGDQIKQALSTQISNAVGSGGVLLLIVCFCTLADSVLGAAGSVGSQAVRLSGAAAVTLAALSDLTSMIGLGSDTLENLSTFTTILMPTLTTAAAASGGLTAAPVRQMAALLCSNLLNRLITAVLLPMTYAYAAGCIASAALNTPRLQSLCALLRWCVVTSLTVALLLYTGYLTIAGGVAAAADAATIKAAQMAISGMVPLVGGILSSASETVVSGATLLRSSIGIFGVLGVLGFCAVPFLKLGGQFLLYKLIAALSSILSDHPVSKLIQGLGDVFALVMAMTGASALVTLLALFATITAVTP